MASLKQIKLIFDLLRLFPRDVECIIIEYMLDKEIYVKTISCQYSSDFLNVIDHDVIYQYNTQNGQMCKQNINNICVEPTIGTFSGMHVMNDKIYIIQRTSFTTCDLLVHDKECRQLYSYNLHDNIFSTTQIHDTMYICSANFIHILDKDEMFRYELDLPEDIIELHTISVIGNKIYLYISTVTYDHVCILMHFIDGKLVRPIQKCKIEMFLAKKNCIPTKLQIINNEIYVSSTDAIIRVFDMNMKYKRKVNTVRQIDVSYNSADNFVYSGKYFCTYSHGSLAIDIYEFVDNIKSVY